MEYASKNLFWVDDTYADYAVVNEVDSTLLSTDFLLGDQMSLEVCFKLTKTEYSGDLAVGSGITAHTDTNDYRFFFHDEHIICDCGQATNYNVSGGRYAMKFTDLSEWHDIKFPILIGNAAKVLFDDKDVVNDSFANAPAPMKPDGIFGTLPMPLCLFASDSKQFENGVLSQKIAIRYVNVWKFNTNELLASFWPDKKSNGIIDLISQKSYMPVIGEVKIMKWKKI